MKYSKKYPTVKCFLLYFLIFGEEVEPVMKDIDIIKKYVSIFDKEEIGKTLREGKEILELEKFPESWVVDVSNHAPTLKFETYKDWFKYIIDNLEIESNKH